MPIYTPSDAEQLRAEIASAAARLIAEDGADYATAKKKAAKQILGGSKVRGDVLPDNAQVEEEVRQYNALFFGEEQAERLLHLRQVALEWMHEFAGFHPYLTGAVLNGTAGIHSDIHLQLFTDDSKDVAIHLINKNIVYEVSENRHFRHPHLSVEVLSFMSNAEGVHLAIYPSDDFRGAVKTAATQSAARIDASALALLINESTTR